MLSAQPCPCCGEPMVARVLPANHDRGPVLYHECPRCREAGALVVLSPDGDPIPATPSIAGQLGSKPTRAPRFLFRWPRRALDCAPSAAEPSEIHVSSSSGRPS